MRFAEGSHIEGNPVYALFRDGEICGVCGDTPCAHGYCINLECLNRIPCDRCDKHQEAA